MKYFIIALIIFLACQQQAVKIENCQGIDPYITFTIPSVEEGEQTLLRWMPKQDFTVNRLEIIAIVNRPVGEILNFELRQGDQVIGVKLDETGYTQWNGSTTFNADEFIYLWVYSTGQVIINATMIIQYELVF